MTCETIAPLLEDDLDGILSPEDRARVEAHLATCAVCRREVEALRSVLADARSLPRSVMPARDLWNGIEERLGGSASVHDASYRPTARPPVRLLLRLAAALALILAGAALANLIRKDAAVSTAFTTEQQRYATETAELARQVTQNPDGLPEATRAVVERNLAIVDAAIRDAEAALVTDPGNTALEQMVLARYEQRLALLQRATAAGRREL